MIWFTLALFAVTFLVTALLAPKPKVEDARAQNLDDVNFPQSTEGAPIALLLGSCRQRGPNSLWYGDFRSVPIRKKVKTGIFSSKRITVGYKYYLGLAMGLCLGPGVVIKRIWLEKDEVWSGSAGPAQTALSINLPSLFGGDEEGGGFVGTLRFSGGGFDQPVNAYMAGKLAPEQTPAYGGQAIIVLEHCYIGTQAQLKSMSFELVRYTNDLGLASGVNIIGEDLNPAEILYQLLTLEWGGLNVDPNDIEVSSFVAAGQTLADEGNGMSLIISSANSGKSAIEEVLRQIDGIMYQDPTTGKIVLDLIRRDYDVEELIVLDETNVVSVRNFSRTSWEDTINQVRVSFTNRANKFEKGSALVQDMANINSQGRLRSTNISFPGVTEPALAIKIATREMAQLSVPLFKATLEVNRRAAQLRPGEPLILSWPEYGIDQVVMRVQRFNLGELIDGRIVIDCVQDKFATDLTVFAAPEPTLHTPIDRSALPVTQASVAEVPYWLMARQQFIPVPPSASNRTYVMALARSPGEFQQGYSATIVQGAESALAVDRDVYSDTAILRTGFDRLAGFATGTMATMVIEAPSDAGAWLVAATTAQTREGANLIAMGAEILSFETVTPGAGFWTLGNVRRGLLDTRAVDHSAGAVIYLLSADAISESEWLGTTALTGRFQSFTDRDETPFDSAASFALTPDRRYERPLPPDFVQVDGSRTPATITTIVARTITWRARSRLTALIASENDAADTEEAGVTYTLRVFLNGTLQAGKTQTGLASASASLIMDSGWNGTARIEIASVRAGLESRTAGFIEVAVNIP